MPQSVTAVRLPPGRKWSKAAAAPLSTAGATSIDVLTVTHGLLRSPSAVTLTVRTVVAVPSGGCPVPVVDSWNGSLILIRLPAEGGGASAIQVDVVAYTEHSAVS